MLAADHLRRKGLDVQRKLDERDASVAQLSEDLARKELREHELEMAVKDLKAQLVFYEDVEDKLALANRNARVLEEENNALLSKLRDLQGPSESNHVRKSLGHREEKYDSEALKLIRENGNLVDERNQMKDELSVLKKRCLELEQYVDACMRQSESQNHELLGKVRQAEAKARENERLLKSERESFAADRELWEKDLKQFQLDKSELLLALHHAETLVAQKKEPRVKLERSAEQQVAHLRQELREAEATISAVKQEHLIKEQQWLAEKSKLKAYIDHYFLAEPNTGPTAQSVIHELQQQLAAFQVELGNMQWSPKSPAHSCESECGSEGGAFASSSAAPTSAELVATRDALQAASKKLHDERLSYNNEKEELLKENRRLHSELFSLQEQLGAAQDQSDELVVRCRELEVDVVTAQKALGSLQRKLENEQAVNAEAFLGSSTRTIDGVFPPGAAQQQDVSNLARELLQCQAELEKERAARECSDAMSSEREAEHQKQLEELLLENEMLRRQSHAYVKESKKNITDSIAHQMDQSNSKEVNIGNGNGSDDALTLAMKLVGAHGDWSKFSDAYSASMIKMNRDKVDSVEDLMRHLEAAWASEDEAKRQAKRSARQAAEAHALLSSLDEARTAGGTDKESALQNIQQQADRREESLRRELVDAIIARERSDHLAKRLQDDANATSSSVSRPRGSEVANADELHRLRDQLRSQDSEIQKMKDQLNHFPQGQLRLGDSALSLKKEEEYPVHKSRAKSADCNQSKERGLTSRSSQTPRTARNRSRTPRTGAMRDRGLENLKQSQLSIESSEERRRNAVPEGAHLQVTIVELSELLRNGRPIIEPGYIMVKLKSVKEKYKTSVKELASVVRFDETFVFYLAQPDEDIITLHVFYKTKSGSREYHIGDSAFSMATLYRGVPRKRIAPVAQNPGTKDARRAGQIEVIMQTDDFGRVASVSEAEVEDERLRFNDLVNKLEVTCPEKLHAVDVHLAGNTYV